MIKSKKPSLPENNCQYSKNYHFKYKNKFFKFSGTGNIKIHISDDLKKWKLFNNSILKSRKNYFDSSDLNLLDVLCNDKEILLFYFITKPFALGLAIFNKKNPEELIFRTASPIWETKDSITPAGIKQIQDVIVFSFKKKSKIYNVAIALDYILGKKQKSIFSIVDKIIKNPIIQPNRESHWESCATFNAAAIYLDNKVHFLYRAIGGNGISVLGYASSKDGLTLDDRLSRPVYTPSQPFECRKDDSNVTLFPYMSGGGWGGCEDPRLTQIDDRIYMTYTAFNGIHPPNVALTSISVKDFLNKKWKWGKPVSISPPGEIHKNWVIFPEKINNKFVILHNLSPGVCVDYFDTLDFEDNPEIKSHYTQIKRKNCWDTHIRGVGPAPIKVKDGWLVFYHAMDEKMDKYKIGAMILDYSDPTKILYRADFPIIEPDRHYENNGCKAGVVYTCGAVVIKDRLFIYYGGADTVVCGANTDLDKLLEHIKTDYDTISTT